MVGLVEVLVDSKLEGIIRDYIIKNEIIAEKWHPDLREQLSNIKHKDLAETVSGMMKKFEFHFKSDDIEIKLEGPLIASTCTLGNRASIMYPWEEIILIYKVSRWLITAQKTNLREEIFESIKSAISPIE